MAACAACGAPILWKAASGRQDLTAFDQHEQSSGERWVERDGLMRQAVPGWEGKGYAPHKCSPTRPR